MRTAVLLMTLVWLCACSGEKSVSLDAGDTDTDSDTGTDTGEYVPQACGDEDIVIFSDPNLETAVRKSVNLYVFDLGYNVVWSGDLTGEVLAQLEQLSFTSGKGISSLEGIECLVNVKKANTLFDNSITDVGLLAHLGELEELDIADNLATDLQPLEGLTKMSRLRISRNPIESMDPVAQLVNLEYVEAEGVGMEDLDWLENLDQISGLQLSDNDIEDISIFSEHPQLRRIELENNQVADISALAGHDDLVALWLSGNQISDISPLATATVYDSIRLADNEIEDISALASMGGSLMELFLNGNEIEDLTPLSGLTNLNALTLWDNRISDLSPLVGLPIVEWETHWDFWRNEISDLSPLASFGDLQVLDISENNVTDLGPLAGTDINELRAGGNEIHSLAPLLGMNMPYYLDFTDNRVVSLSPLIAWSRIAPSDGATEVLLGNPLGEIATELDIPRLCETMEHSIYFGEGETCDWVEYPIDPPDYDPDPPPWTGSEPLNPEGCDGAPSWLATGALPGDSHSGADYSVNDTVPAAPIVEDMVTGLQWRRCSSGQSWDGAGCDGTAAAFSFEDAETACDGSFGGYSDWRLPSASELASIVDHSVSYPGPTIDTTAFPATYTGGYWAATELPSTAGRAGWTVNFYNGEMAPAIRWDDDANRRVRCVRGGVGVVVWEDRFTATSTDEPTVVDSLTGLEWRRCAQGQAWDGATCAGFGDPVSGTDAASACDGTFDGHSDWRLATIQELSSIANRCGADPASHSEAFPGLPGAPFWSSTVFPDTIERAWTVDFGYGWTAFADTSSDAWVRCVRVH